MDSSNKGTDEQGPAGNDAHEVKPGEGGEQKKGPPITGGLVPTAADLAGNKDRGMEKDLFEAWRANINLTHSPEQVQQGLHYWPKVTSGVVFFVTLAVLGYLLSAIVQAHGWDGLGTLVALSWEMFTSHCAKAQNGLSATLSFLADLKTVFPDSGVGVGIGIGLTSRWQKVRRKK